MPSSNSLTILVVNLIFCIFIDDTIQNKKPTSHRVVIFNFLYREMGTGRQNCFFKWLWPCTRIIFIKSWKEDTVLKNQYVGTEKMILLEKMGMGVCGIQTTTRNYVCLWVTRTCITIVNRCFVGNVINLPYYVVTNRGL